MRGGRERGRASTGGHQQAPRARTCPTSSPSRRIQAPKKLGTGPELRVGKVSSTGCPATQGEAHVTTGITQSRVVRTAPHLGSPRSSPHQGRRGNPVSRRETAGMHRVPGRLSAVGRTSAAAVVASRVLLLGQGFPGLPRGPRQVNSATVCRAHCQTLTSSPEPGGRPASLSLQLPVPREAPALHTSDWIQKHNFFMFSASQK